MISMDAVTENEDRERIASPPYRLYGLIFLFFLLVRFLDLATADLDWTVWVYESRLCFLGLSAAAVVLAFLGGAYLKQRMPRVMAWLVSGLIGASCLLLINSTFGLVLGLCVGGLAVFLNPSPEASGSRWFPGAPAWLVSAVSLTVLALLTTMLVGACSGAAMVLAFVTMGQASLQMEILTIVVPLLVGFVAWIFIDRRLYPTRRWYAWIGMVGWFVSCVLMGLSTMLVVDSQRRQAAIPHVGMHSLTFSQLWQGAGRAKYRPILVIAEEWMKSWHVGSLSFGFESSDADIEYARGFLSPLSLSFEEGSQVSDAGMRKLSTRRLWAFRCGAGTQLTDTGVRDLNPRHLQSLELEGPNFTDAALVRLSSASALQYLNLKGARVTTAGLKNLDPTAPLWLVDLSNTLVDDEVLEVLAPYRTISLLRLAGTRVTGEGLRHFRGRSINLDLSDTAFDPARLADLLAPAGTEPLFNSIFVSSLQLRHVELPPEAFSILAQVSSIDQLDVIGSKVSDESLKLLGTLPLRNLALDGDQLRPELLPLLKSGPELLLAYDAEEMDLGQIRDHVIGLLEASSVKLSGSGTGTAMKVSLLLYNVTIGSEEMELLEAIGAHVDIALKDAVLPNGSREDFSNMLDVFVRFRNKLAEQR